MKLLLLFFILLCVNPLLAQTTVTINCTGASGSYNSGSVSPAGTRAEGALNGLGNGGGNRGWATFNLNAIPPNATVTGASLKFITYNSVSSASANDIYGFTGTVSIIVGVPLYTICANGNSFDNSAWIANGINTKSLNTNGISFLQANIGSIINLGFIRSSPETYNIYGYASAASSQPQLTITYNLPPCTGTPIGGTTNSTRDSICYVSIFTLSVSGSTGANASGLAYQWQQSADGITWDDIAGATEADLSKTQPATTYYRRKISCSTNTSYSSVKLIKTNPVPAGGSTLSTLEGVCDPATSFTLSVSGATTTPVGLAYQWQSSTDSVTWNDIAGSISATLTTSQATTTLYRRIIACGTSFNTSVAKRVYANQLANGGTIKGTRYFCSSGQTVKLYVTGNSFLNGITYQWQQSPDGVNFTNISGATQDTLNTTISSETYYRRANLCGGNPTYSDTRFIRGPGAVTPIYKEFIGEGLSCLTQDTANRWQFSIYAAIASGSTRTGTSGTLAQKWFFLPAIQLVGKKTYTINYYRTLSGTDINESALRLAVGVSANPASMTTSLSFENSWDNPANANKTTQFTPSASGQYYFGFAYSAEGPNSTRVIINDLSIKLSPSCPSPQNFTATNLTSTTAKINWIIDTTQGYDVVQNYNWYLKQANSNSVADSGITNVKEVNLLNLYPDTNYVFEVRTNCVPVTQIPVVYNFPFRTRVLQDECLYAIRLNQATYNESCNGLLINTANSSPSPNPPLQNSADFDDDLWYKFSAVSTTETFRYQNFTVTTGNSQGLVYALYSDSCNTQSLLSSDSIPANSGGGETTVTGLTIGQTYYLRLATKGVNAKANFRFCALFQGPTICPGSSTYLISGNATAGSTYQWQVDAGSGYMSISDNNTYSGTTSDTLKLNVPATTLYDYKYRCVINGTIYSPEYILKFSVSWTGNSSTAWEDAANWNCGILPDENTDVIVNTGLINYPLVNMNTACGSLKLMPGTTVVVKNSVTINIKRK